MFTAYSDKNISMFCGVRVVQSLPERPAFWFRMDPRARNLPIILLIVTRVGGFLSGKRSSSSLITSKYYSP